KQFALTIAGSISISLFAALTFAPTLSAMLLHGDVESHGFFFDRFNKGYSRFRGWYDRTLPKILHARWAVAAIFVAALVLTGILFRSTPTGFIPNEDQGYFIVLVQA